MENQDKLKEMLTSISGKTITGLNTSINSIENQQEDLNEQVETSTEIMAISAQDMREYLELTKMPLIDPLARIQYGSAFGVLNISNWIVWKYGPESEPIYLYCMPGGIDMFPSGLNWDEDEKILQYSGEFDCAYDLIHSEISQSGTYGLLDMISKLDSAKSLLNNNLNKYVDVVNKFTRFLNL
jgi:hypothetical protein